MAAALARRAEVEKLARLLGSEPAELDYLAEVEPEDLRALRAAVTDVLFDGDRKRFERIAATSRVVPSRLAAAIAQRTFGPLLCARMAGLVDPGEAAAIAAHLAPDFRADIAVEMDPRRATEVLIRLPDEHVAQAAETLTERREFVTMGQFVGHLNDSGLRAATAVLDAEALLRTAFVMDNPDELDRVLAMLSDERLEGVLRTAVAAELWPEALDLFDYLGTTQRQRVVALGERFEGLDPQLRVTLEERLGGGA